MADRTPRRTSSAGSPLVRALAALEDVDAPAAADAFAPRLARWVGWRHAVALAATLDEPPPPPACRAADAAAAAGRSGAKAFMRERARVRDVLATRASDLAAQADAATWRPSYTACQQAMAARIGPLRARLRTALAAGSPALAQLAELDAVMEDVVAPREQVLLGSVAGRLAARQAAAHRSDELASLRAELETLLLAELDLRLQPVDALLDALGSSE